jgi:hypothetical protein
MAHSKHAPEVKSKPSCKCTAIDLEIKVRMICKYEGVQSLSEISCELALATSTVNTIVKDAAHKKDHKKEMAMIKLIITKKR